MPFKDVKGVSTFYSDYGKSKDNHVLFIHGLGSSSIAWRDIPYALSLSEYFHTITIDLVGFGQSAKPDNPNYYEINGFSKFILDFIETIGIKDKISIVGHSLGGYVAAQVAIDNKERIEKLVLIDSSGLLEKPTLLLEQYLDAAMELEPILRYKKLERVLSGIYANPSFLPPFVVEKFIETIIEEGARSAFKKAYENSTTTQIKPEGLKQIQDIPCLIIWGKEDRLIPIKYCEKFKEKLSEIEAKAKYEVIERAGHAPFVEWTALIYQKLSTFLMKDDHMKYSDMY
jgi:pimeloyl-ACP methyl ester carboxylesterase